jgi:SAM-dependent methyltransferase
MAQASDVSVAGTALQAPTNLDPGRMAGIGTHAVVAALLDPPGGGAVLDAGAGEGAFTAWLSEHGYRVIAAGIEAKQFRFGGARYVRTNLDEGLPFVNGSLEGITAIEVIEHLENPLHLFREAARCLADGGWIVVTTPNVQSISSRLSFLLRANHLYFGRRDYEGNGHISPVGLDQIVAVAERTGLKVDVITYNLGKLPIPRLRHRLLLRHRWFINSLWGDALIVRLRKAKPPQTRIHRG